MKYIKLDGDEYPVKLRIGEIRKLMTKHKLYDINQMSQLFTDVRYQADVIHAGIIGGAAELGVKPITKEQLQEALDKTPLSKFAEVITALQDEPEDAEGKAITEKSGEGKWLPFS